VTGPTPNATERGAHPLGAPLDARTTANTAFFDVEAARLAVLCHGLAKRFARGGRLFAAGCTPAARSDAHHVAVEFVHPVIVGKRALPALGITGAGGVIGAQLGTLVGPDDVLIAFGAEDGDPAACSELAHAIATARRRGALTIAFGAIGAELLFEPPTADPFIRQELVETLYHILWELVHVFFEHRGLLGGRTPAGAGDTGAAGFLYPFLADAEADLDTVLEDVRRSILMKAHEVATIRAAMIDTSGPALVAAAATLRDSLARGGTVLALGNGGSATDAMDLVADLRAPPGRAQPRAALDLTAGASILTAIANDVGVDAVFARQVIAYGREGDVLVAFSTSGGSRNVLQALAEARRRGLRTVAFVGYDGGPITAEGLADHVIIAPSQHVPRIQEAHATGYHLLCELLDTTLVG
jgi:D-sedoheptulose 7-phosphate isomerase